MVSTNILTWLEYQPTLTLQINALIFLVPHISPKMIHHLSRQSLKFSVSERRIFSNYVEELDTSMICALFVILNYSLPVLGQIWMNSMHFIMMKWLNHEESETSNLHNFASNTTPLLPIPVLKFYISWVYSTIAPLIMVMYRFPLNIIPWNINLTLFLTQIVL